MKSYLKIGIGLFVVALSLNAFAGSITTETYSTSVQGVSNTTVQGTFTYNTVTDTFTSESLSFAGNSIFGGLSGTVYQQQHGSTFTFNQTISGYTISYQITVNPSNPGSYTAMGYISNGSQSGLFKFTPVPDGGDIFSYLAASGCVLFAALLLSNRRRALLARP